ncbi:uncharacterized protein PAC_02392 [Phialocephala subalpina]|uniref:Uncharacterized protein n=1 Tax=Phialocephala subalpina TaxID=576137 RepID=A0A1L7WIC8_9HELO|nr:uncharacterized protein PAC_02392 [Phialocephala subalpina]
MLTGFGAAAVDPRTQLPVRFIPHRIPMAMTAQCPLRGNGGGFAPRGALRPLLVVPCDIEYIPQSTAEPSRPLDTRKMSAYPPGARTRSRKSCRGVSRDDPNSKQKKIVQGASGSVYCLQDDFHGNDPHSPVECENGDGDDLLSGN